MPALNRVQLIGRLGKDPEVRHTNKGTAYTVFSLAVSRFWKKGGERQQETDWFNIEAWGKMGEICQEYLKKGKLVFLEGSLRTTSYEKDGETRYFTKVVLQSMQMLEKKGKEEIEELDVAEEEGYYS